MTDSASTPLAAPGSLPRLPAAKSLFSLHYLQARLPEHVEWAEDPLPVFEAVRRLWERARALGGTWNEAQTEQEFVKPVLEALGWSYIVQVKAQRRGGSLTRPDYALFTDPAAKELAYPDQGNDDAFYGRTAAIAEAKYWGRPLSQQDASGRNTWKAESNPSHQMVSYLVGTRCPWGILTNGRTWRLYSREVSSVASEFYETDLGLIFDFLDPDGVSHTRANGRLQALVALLPSRRLPGGCARPFVRAAGARGFGHLCQARQRQAEGAGLRRSDAGDRQRFRGLSPRAVGHPRGDQRRACGRSTPRG